MTSYKIHMESLSSRSESDEASDSVPTHPRVARRQLDHLLTVCGNGTCPTLYRASQDSFVVQGYAVSAEDVGIDLPDGELLVEIPAELIRRAVAAGQA